MQRKEQEEGENSNIGNSNVPKQEVKTKKIMKYSHCNRTGHTKRSCQKRRHEEQMEKEEEMVRQEERVTKSQEQQPNIINNSSQGPEHAGIINNFNSSEYAHKRPLGVEAERWKSAQGEQFTSLRNLEAARLKRQKALVKGSLFICRV